MAASVAEMVVARTRPCGKGRTPCRKSTYHVPGYETEACRTHLTKAQREIAEQREQDTLPACWSWVVTDSDRRAAEDAFPYTVRQILMWWQKGQCAICASADRRFVLDHDHSSDLVRGVLCETCNSFEGYRSTGVYARYHEKNPAMMLGITVPYRMFSTCSVSDVLESGPRGVAAVLRWNLPANELTEVRRLLGVDRTSI